MAKKGSVFAGILKLFALMFVLVYLITTGIPDYDPNVQLLFTTAVAILGLLSLIIDMYIGVKIYFTLVSAGLSFVGVSISMNILFF